MQACTLVTAVADFPTLFDGASSGMTPTSVAMMCNEGPAGLSAMCFQGAVMQNDFMSPKPVNVHPPYGG